MSVVFYKLARNLGPTHRASTFWSAHIQFCCCKWYKFWSPSPWDWWICLVKGRSRRTVLPCINFCRCCYHLIRISLDKPVVWLRLKIYPAVWKVCIPSGNVSFSVFISSVWVCALSSDSCHLQEFWLHRKLWSMWGLLSCGSRGICRLLVQGTDTFTGETSKACSCCSNLGKQNSFSAAISWKRLSWPFIVNTQLECMCVFSFQKCFLCSFFWKSAWPSSPSVPVLSPWADRNKESWKRWGWSLACRLLCARVLLSSLLRLRPERTDVYVIYASVIVYPVHVCFMSTVLQTYSV